MMDIQQLARPEILSLEPYESARSSAAADGVLLNANEAPFTLAGDPAFEGLALNRYPQPQPAELKRRLADIYAVDEANLLVTRGSDEGIDLLLRVFCRAGRDAMIECPPCFGMYRIAAAIQGAAVVSVPRTEDNDWQIDVEALCSTIKASAACRLVFLTSPNNPTGDLLAPGSLLRILAACEDRALVVLDEAYIEFCDMQSACGLISQYPQLVVLRTLSKAWAAAGLRCGTVIADPVVISLLKRVMAPYPLSSTSIDAAMQVTGGDAPGQQAALLDLIRNGKRDLLDFLGGRSWVSRVWPGVANFVLVGVDDAGALVAFCADAGVRIRDFSSTPRLNNCVRITIGSPSEMSLLKTTLMAYGDR